jgi:hypothetical protein
MEISGQLHTPLALPARKAPVPILQEAGWTPKPVWATWRRGNSWLYQDSNTDPPVIHRNYRKHWRMLLPFCLFGLIFELKMEAILSSDTWPNLWLQGDHSGRQGPVTTRRSYPRTMTCDYTGIICQNSDMWLHGHIIPEDNVLCLQGDDIPEDGDLWLNGDHIQKRVTRDYKGIMSQKTLTCD